MNLNQNPTKDELRQLLAGANDDAHHHVLWVSTNGQVNLTALDGSVEAAQFSTTQPSFLLQLDDYLQGHGCVGLEAANDAGHVDGVFEELLLRWRDVPGAGTSAIVKA